jgi:hypothetical protein
MVEMPIQSTRSMQGVRERSETGTGSSAHAAKRTGATSMESAPKTTSEMAAVPDVASAASVTAMATGGKTVA